MAFAASAIESCRSPARRVTNVKANATPFTTSRRRTTVRRGDPRVPVRRRRLHSGPGFPPVFEISFRRTADMMIGAGPSRRSDRTCNPVERVAAVTTNGSRTGNSTNARSFCATRFDRKPPPHCPQTSFIRPEWMDDFTFQNFCTTAIVATAARQKGHALHRLDRRTLRFGTCKNDNLRKTHRFQIGTEHDHASTHRPFRHVQTASMVCTGFISRLRSEGNVRTRRHRRSGTNLDAPLSAPHWYCLQ